MQEYPLAHGHVHITHADDVSAPADFVPGYLESSVPLPRRSPVQPSHKQFVVYQEGGRDTHDVGVQVPARDRTSHAALPR